MYKRADEPFIEASNSDDDKQGWLKIQNSLLKPIWQVGSFLPSALVDIVDSDEQEREQEAFIKPDDFDDCIKEEKDFFNGLIVSLLVFVIEKLNY